MFEEIVIESHRYLHKLLGVDGLLVEYFGHSAHVARELPRQPNIASALSVQFVFNQFSYVRHFFHFASSTLRLISQGTKRKKRKPFRFKCLLPYRGTPTIVSNKHETAHAVKREPVATHSDTI